MNQKAIILASVFLGTAIAPAIADAKQAEKSYGTDLSQDLKIVFRGGEASAKQAANKPFSGICFVDPNTKKVVLVYLDRQEHKGRYALSMVAQTDFSIGRENPMPDFIIPSGEGRYALYNPDLQACSTGIVDPVTRSISASPFKFRFVKTPTFAFTDNVHTYHARIITGANRKPDIQAMPASKAPRLQNIGELAPDF